MMSSTDKSLENQTSAAMRNQRRRSVSCCAAILLAVLLSMCSVERTLAIYVRTEPGETPSYCSVFHHMVKSAGSTMKKILYTEAEEDEGPPPATCTMGHDPKCIEGLTMSPVIVGYGEIVREPLKDVGRDCEYFTMMRDPVDRIVSAFFYCPTDHDVQNRLAKHCGYSDHPDPPTERLLDYAKTRWGSQAFRQMTHSIFCPPNCLCTPAPERRPALVLDNPQGEELFQQAEDILSTYVAVGIMEHFDLSMELFNARVTSDVQDWTIHKQSVNAGKTNELREDVLAWAKTSPELHRVIEADILLYNYAVDLFKRQTAESLGTNWAE
eukprot:g20381.t1